MASGEVVVPVTVKALESHVSASPSETVRRLCNARPGQRQLRRPNHDRHESECQFGYACTGERQRPCAYGDG